MKRSAESPSPSRRRYNFKGIPLDIVRKVTTHTLIGLDYLLSAQSLRDRDAK